MMKKEKGITLVTLVITIIVMLIIVSTTVYISMDRFEINDLKKMINDLELLEDKVSNYYSQYGRLPILGQYTYTSLDFEKNAGDNSVYYILDLSAMGDLALNYGEEGFKSPNTTEDTYIINEASKTIYYVKGIKRDGKIYHYINQETISVADNVPPTTPEIKVISGMEKESGFYITEVQIDIIAGKDNWTGVQYTVYSLDNGNNWSTFTGANSVITLSNGEYDIKVKTYDNNNLSSKEVSLSLEVHTEHTWNTTVLTEATCITEGVVQYTCTNSKCGETYTETTSGAGHDYVEIEEVAVTCTSAGYITYKCSLCGATYSEKTEEKLEHDTYETTTEATCTEAGTVKVICRRCGEELYTQTSEEALGHDEEITEVAGTCTEEGYVIGRCKRCNNTLFQDSTGIAGHNYKLTSSTSATCSTAGKKTYTCSICNATYTETTAATSHIWVTQSTTDVTCTKNATKTYKCSYCSQTKTEITSYATGHNWSQYYTSASGLTKKLCNHTHSITFKCSKCSSTWARTEGHWMPTGGTVTPPGTLTAGSFSCVCGYNIDYGPNWSASDEGGTRDVDADYWRHYVSGRDGSNLMTGIRYRSMERSLESI